MIQIYDDSSLEDALATMLDNTTRELVGRIVADARASDLWELTCIVIIADHNTAGEFEAVLGYPPSTGPLGGEGAAPVPYWSWREDHGDTVELLVPAGDEGFCWFLIMPRAWFDTRIGLD
jgi:hypothetical protein